DWSSDVCSSDLRPQSRRANCRKSTWPTQPGFNDGCFPVVIEPLLILHESRGIITWQASERTSWPTDHRGAACTVSITRACSSLLSTRGDTTGAPVSVRKKGVCL